MSDLSKWLGEVEESNCVVCDQRKATELADSDKIQYQDGMPVCLECYMAWGMDPHEFRVI